MTGYLQKNFKISLASFTGSSPTQGGRQVADARNQQPFEKGTESCSLRAFLHKPPCRTCKRDLGFISHSKI